MKRPVLNEVELDSAKSCKLIITMSPGQWDALLQGVYDAGGVLIEIEEEIPVRAFQRRREEAENPFDSICGRCITETEARKVYPLSYKKKKGA